MSAARMREMYPSMFARADHVHAPMGDIAFHRTLDARMANPLVEENNLAVVKARATAKRDDALQVIAMADEIDRLRTVCHGHYERAESQHRLAETYLGERNKLKQDLEDSEVIRRAITAERDSLQQRKVRKK